MTGCLRAREVVVAIRERPGKEPRNVHLICPGQWTRAALLRYVRGEHPEATVKIVEWMPSGSSGDPWMQRLWLVNPDGFANYPRAIPDAP